RPSPEARPTAPRASRTRSWRRRRCSGRSARQSPTPGAKCGHPSRGCSCTTAPSVCRRCRWERTTCAARASSSSSRRRSPRSSRWRCSWPRNRPEERVVRVCAVTRTPIAELSNHIDERVMIRGWVNAVRDQKRMQFLIVRDETGLAQAVLDKQDPPGELNDAVSALTAESAITVTGTVVADERVKLGGLELRIEQLQLDSLAEPELPITVESALDKRIDWRYLDLRRPERRLIFEVQTTTEHAMREFWCEQRFIELHSPKLMGSASESGAELFRVDYFDTSAYLAQSPQFYKQMAMAAGFGPVFEIGPVFRANP